MSHNVCFTLKATAPSGKEEEEVSPFGGFCTIRRSKGIPFFFFSDKRDFKNIESIKIQLNFRKLAIMKVSSNFRGTTCPGDFILIALTTLHI